MNDTNSEAPPLSTEPSTDAFLRLSEEFEIWILFAQVFDGMMKARENELRPYGLSSIQLGVLYVVTAGGGSATGIQIARKLLRHPTSMYQLLQRMEKQQLVNLIRSTEGKREVRVELTDRGKYLYRNHSRQVIPRILEALSTRDREQFKRTLNKLRTRVYEELTEQPLYP